jgi:glutathione S-transferase
MKLIGSLTSPYVRKVRIVLAEKKIEHQFILENVWAETTNISAFNPLGKIPCLLMEDNGTLFDSRVIVEYLDTLTPIGKLLPPTGRERAEVRCWEALADGIIDATVTTFLEETQREPEQRSHKWTERQWRKIVLGMQAMSQGLGDRPWCHDKHLTLADIAVGCALGYLDLRTPEFNWRKEHPNLAKFFNKLSARPSFAETIAINS